MKTYRINECFYSLQGEGIRAGTANVFVRFSGCNLACDIEEGPKSPGGFGCDTEFTSGRSLTLEEIRNYVNDVHGSMNTERVGDSWLILTGGEPGLQVDKEFCEFFHGLGWKLAIETNGSVALPEGQGGFCAGNGTCIDWVTVSPKVAEHAIRQRRANEVKYVRGYGQGIPKTVVEAEHYLISPAFSGDSLDKRALDWCVRLCLDNPKWRLSVQQHKALFGGVR